MNDFRTAFCALAGCRDAAFEQTLFRRGLPHHVRPLAGLLRRTVPGFFRDDFELIRWLGGDRTLAEVREDLERFRYQNRVSGGWWRRCLHLHLDPDRIRALARRCLEV